MAQTLKVVPAYIELKKGEEKQIQVITDAENYYVTTNVDGLVEFDRLTNEVHGLKAGSCDLIFKLFDDKGNVTATDSIRVDIVDETVGDTPTRIMLHNRYTNCLYTILGQSAKEDLVISLPKKSGTLLTRSELEGYTKNIDRPVIVSPVTGSRDYGTEFKCTPIKFRLKYFEEIAAYTYWEFALDPDFKNVIYTISNKDPEDMTTVNANLSGINCYVRVRWHTNQHYSDWSDSIIVSFSYNVPYPEFPEPLVGDLKDVAYFGKLDKTLLESNFIQYRGDYDTLIANELKTFKVNDTTSYKNKLYRCLRPITGQTADEINELPESEDGSPKPSVLVTPGVDASVWVEETTRPYLPDFKLLAAKMNIGIGVTDNNQDGLSSKNVKCGDWAEDIADATWVKVGYRGKILYIADRVVVNDICWNDLAKCYLVYGNRTLRINGATYRVRLLREEEIVLFFQELTTKFPEQIKTDPFVTKVKEELIEDWQEGFVRNVLNLELKTTTNATTIRTNSWRPVLEYVKEGAEPYRNQPACVNADDEKLQYDPYTDTGYYGTVSEERLRTAEDVALDLKWTSSFFNKKTYWYKFYYQGLILYTPAKIIKGDYRRSYGLNNHYNHAHNMGSVSDPKVVKDGVTYQYGLMSLCKTYPMEYPSADQDVLEWARGSMITELYQRMFVPYNKDKKGSYTYWMGYQVGNSWTKLTAEEFFPASHTLASCDHGAHTGSYDTWFSGFSGSYEHNSTDDVAALMLLPIEKYN